MCSAAAVTAHPLPATFASIFGVPVSEPTTRPQSADASEGPGPETHLAQYVVKNDLTLSLTVNNLRSTTRSSMRSEPTATVTFVSHVATYVRVRFRSVPGATRDGTPQPSPDSFALRDVHRTSTYVHNVIAMWAVERRRHTLF
jgi:hypothetical protein